MSKERKQWTKLSPIYQRKSEVEKNIANYDREIRQIDGLMNLLKDRRNVLRKKISKQAKYRNSLIERIHELRKESPVVQKRIQKRKAASVKEEALVETY